MLGADRLAFTTAMTYSVILYQNTFFPLQTDGMWLGTAVNRWYGVVAATMSADSITAATVVNSPYFNATYAGGLRWEGRADAGWFWNPAIGPELRHSGAIINLAAGNLNSNVPFSLLLDNCFAMGWNSRDLWTSIHKWSTWK